jgi:polysaccharide export outer membrane protein
MMRLIIMLCVSLLAVFGAPAQASEYLLGPGDLVSVDVFGHPDMRVDMAQVNEKDEITVPLVGSVVVGGMTTTDAATRIATKLDSGGFIVKPVVSVLVTQYFSKRVVVLGQVAKPGKYPLDSVSKLSDVLALAGGISVDGSSTVILVHKQNGSEVRTPIDTRMLFQQNHPELDAVMADGDIVYVPRAEVFYIYGEVQHPGAYRLEKNMNVMQAISLGGGLTLKGTEKGVQIRRTDENGKVTALPAKSDTLLQTNDVVYLNESLF